jgi:BASS family bile acid:Na+ symporter
MTPIDQIRLDFDPGSLTLLNVILGLVVFGISLDLSVDDFRRVLRRPRGVAVGLVTQLLLLPAMTFGLILLFEPPPSIALGMLLVASCPGGNVSNFFTHLSGGNAELSITVTSLSTMACALTTPLNMSLWGGRLPGTAKLLEEVSLDPLQLAGTIGLLIVLPLMLGMGLATARPKWAQRLEKPFRYGSVLFFVAFVGIAFSKNVDAFLEVIGRIFLIVLVHNAAAFALGQLSARAGRLGDGDRRALTIEVGIQNSGLGLILIFDFFEGLGGMAVVAAWWGIWHIVAGLTIAGLWARRPPTEPTPALE